jgi:metal-sulfur cluster biosynthetic enzyme
MFIQTEATRNPNVIKFMPGREVLPEGPMALADRRAAAHSPLGLKLFDVEGVAAVTFGADYIAVTKGHGDWRYIKPMVLGVMLDHFMTGGAVIEERSASGPDDETEDDPISADVRQALRLVIDPELGYNIVDLGLIYGISVTDGAARILMTTTTRGCPATDYLRSGSHAAASAVEGVVAVEVELTYDPPWVPQMMGIEAKIHFGITD